MHDKWNSIGEVHSHAKKAVNKKVKSIIFPETYAKYNPRNKGWVGNSIESDWFGIPNNSKKEADFPHLNLELKVTPIVHTRNGWSAKERLVLNIFDFHDEYKRQFNNSSFLEKSSLIELIHYEFVKDTPAPDFQIKAATLFNLKNIPEEDKLIIEQDWNLIIDKIKDGKAEELSDSLTNYLGATTKGGKKESNMTTQPFSETKAHRRSFTLKGSYMTELARKIMSGTYNDSLEYTATTESSFVAEKSLDYYTPESIIKNVEQLKVKTFEEIVSDQFEPFINLSKKELGRRFNVKIQKNNDKASTPVLAQKMLNLETEIQDTDEFRKAGISVKVVTIDSSQLNKPSTERKSTEGFKLQNHFDFDELINTEWQESNLYNYLSSTRFLLVIFEKQLNQELFKGVKFWNIPVKDLNEKIFESWKKTIKIIKEGVSLEFVPRNNKKGYIVKNNLPAMSDNMILHVRPDAQLSSYKDDNCSLRLPTTSNWINRPTNMTAILTDNYMTKQAFWLNPSYMYQHVDEFFQ